MNRTVMLHTPQQAKLLYMWKDLCAKQQLCDSNRCKRKLKSANIVLCV